MRQSELGEPPCFCARTIWESGSDGVASLLRYGKYSHDKSFQPTTSGYICTIIKPNSVEIWNQLSASDKVWYDDRVMADRYILSPSLLTTFLMRTSSFTRTKNWMSTREDQDCGFRTDGLECAWTYGHTRVRVRVLA